MQNQLDGFQIDVPMHSLIVPNKTAKKLKTKLASLSVS